MPPAAPLPAPALRLPRCISAAAPRAPRRAPPPAPPPAAARRAAFQPRALRAPCRCAAGGPGSVPGGSDGSAFAASEVVRREAAAIFADFGELSRLQPKYLNFDTTGKRLFIAKIEEFLEALKVFTLRYELSDDPFARECMRQLNAKLLEAGLSRRGLMEQLTSMVAMMRAELDREELRGVASASPGSPQSRMMPDMAALMLDPEISAAMDDPKVIAVVQRCANNPALVREYADQPGVYRLLKALFGDPEQAQGQ